MALHQAGDMAGATALYLGILEADAKEPNALLNLSTLYSQQGAFDKAETLIKRLIVAQPKFAYGHFALGNVLGKLGRHVEAAACHGRACALEPTNATYYYNRGIELDALGNHEEALGCFAKAAALQPGNIEALVNHANNLYRLGRLEEGLVAINKVIADFPQTALAYTTRGNIYGAMKRPQDALADYDQAIALQPDLAVAHNNRGNMLDKNAQGGALESYEQAIALNPRYADAHNNRATALNKIYRYEDALESCNTALALNPNSALAYDTRGNALVGLQRYQEALADYDRALALDPNIRTTPWNKALLTLLLGDYEQGLMLYESRWKTEFQLADSREFTQPLWLGDAPLDGKTLFIYPEQGYGDFIQMSRYFPLLLERGATIIAETPNALIPLLANSFAGKRVSFIEHGTLPTVPFDYQIPVMSLPYAFRSTLETIPNVFPYLSVPLAKQTKWNSLLGTKTKPRVGLVWSGAAIHLNDANRSIALSMLEPMLRMPGIEFHSLQREVREHDLPSYALMLDHREQLEDFSDTAALVQAMDVVISVDTSVAHLAGALNRPLWVMLPFMPDYRWLLHRSDSPWYASARLFRQPQRGDWPSVVAQVMEALSVGG